MRVALFALDGLLLFDVDMPTIDDPAPAVVLWNDRVFAEDREHHELIPELLAFRETVALRLELPAGAGL